MNAARLDRRGRPRRHRPAGRACVSASHPAARRLRLRHRAQEAAAHRAGGAARRVAELQRDGTAAGAGPRPPRRAARPARARSLRRHGPPHQHALGQRRQSARGGGARDPAEPAHPHAALEGLDREHRRRAARQGSAARAERGRQRFLQDRRDEDRDETLVRARHDDAAGPAQRLPAGARRISPWSSTNMARSKGWSRSRTSSRRSSARSPTSTTSTFRA